jgi:hypothetical protein
MNSGDGVWVWQTVCQAVRAWVLLLQPATPNPPTWLAGKVQVAATSSSGSSKNGLAVEPVRPHSAQQQRRALGHALQGGHVRHVDATQHLSVQTAGGRHASAVEQHAQVVAARTQPTHTDRDASPSLPPPGSCTQPTHTVRRAGCPSRSARACNLAASRPAMVRRVAGENTRSASATTCWPVKPVAPKMVTSELRGAAAIGRTVPAGSGGSGG